MPRYLCAGEVPAKRHTVAADGRGGRRHEELIGHRGFAGPSTLLYHLGSPSALVAAAPADDLAPRPPPTANRALEPFHLRTAALDDPADAADGPAPAGAADPVTGRHLRLGNDDLG
ncbi:MAG: homogentisate 1,2-dioxygenase, partial [Acidimicrobiales bacterium]